MSSCYWAFSGYGVNLDEIEAVLAVETVDIHDELLKKDDELCYCTTTGDFDAGYYFYISNETIVRNEGSAPIVTFTPNEADEIIFNSLKPFLKEGIVLEDIADSFEHFSAVGCG